jgi:ABC-type antimicrobial peptide transport system permease subunit
LLEDYSDFGEFDPKGRKAKVWQQKLIFNGVIEHINSHTPYTAYNSTLQNNEVRFSYIKYNEIFGTNYTESTLNTFVPHPLTIAHYSFDDVDCENPLFTTEVMVAELYVGTTATMGVSEEIYNLFRKDNFYVNSLYFDGTDGIGAALDMAEDLNYEPQSFAVEGIHTMTKVVDVFVPIFEIIALFLCAAVVFILVNFSSKMIKDKMHEIGILKALGTKNSTIVAVFGLQVTLIAILTCVLSTVGYYFLVGVANDVLFESMKQFVKSRVVLDLDFFTFMPKIALEDCALVAALSAISMIIPMIKIKAIKPVKIIKAKE